MESSIRTGRIKAARKRASAKILPPVQCAVPPRGRSPWFAGLWIHRHAVLAL